ncbi:Sulfate transporter/antisigma-factor antagonist STAS:sulfate transporter [Pseudomonas amygdali pv. ulmi]|uniref:Sulfate transporter/antisigma-factor antagonist STAS:sulfate transporter n=2 Tax=Pseudomonas amygdali TaxID=47877 RepID=A0A3M4SQB4_PSEA0|nr:Sulfate transporter/antisigma-factor antagonist STAS:sulfate transporter [Pseudomonas amygdali pv. ulmi]
MTVAATSITTHSKTDAHVRPAFAAARPAVFDTGISMLEKIKATWFSSVRADVLAGLVVALALIPEAIAFSIITGVDPKVGLYASFCICVVIAFVGGRPAMISAATGAMALLMVNLVKEHGLQYLLAATLLCGVLQIIAGYLRLGELMLFVSRSVVTGFVNALAILIFMAQLPELTHATWPVYAMTAAGLAIIYLFPCVPLLGKLLPSPLVCILLLTAMSIYMGLDVRTVGDMGAMPDSLPVFMWPDVALNLDTLLIILPYSAALAVVGLLESMMTATIVDDLTDTTSDRNRECRGQGIANIASGLIGGMAGCAMIGQSMINVESGGRTRLSTLSAGLLLLIMMLFLGDWLARIPMAALVAVMIMVSISTFSWESIRNLRQYPLSTNIVMVVTVIVVVATHNLAYGVLVGSLLAAMFFASKIARYLDVTSRRDPEHSHRTYYVTGQVFFASAERFMASFDLRENVETLAIDLREAHFWDITAVAALDKVVLKLRRAGISVDVVGMNRATATLVDRFGVHDKPDAIDSLMGH